jgi:hypothetical protein
MTPINDTEKLIAYSRLVAIAAAQSQLDADHALTFCRDAVPKLLAEMEVLSRVSERMELLFPQQTALCEATICSSRWSRQKASEPKPEAQATPKRRSKRTKRARRAAK